MMMDEAEKSKEKPEIDENNQACWDQPTRATKDRQSQPRLRGRRCIVGEGNSRSKNGMCGTCVARIDQTRKEDGASLYHADSHTDKKTHGVHLARQPGRLRANPATMYDLLAKDILLLARRQCRMNGATMSLRNIVLQPLQANVRSDDRPNEDIVKDAKAVCIKS